MFAWESSVFGGLHSFSCKRNIVSGSINISSMKCKQGSSVSLLESHIKMKILFHASSLTLEMYHKSFMMKMWTIHENKNFVAVIKCNTLKLRCFVKSENCGARLRWAMTSSSLQMGRRACFRRRMRNNNHLHSVDSLTTPPHCKTVISLSNT